MKMDCEGCGYEALLSSRRIGELGYVMLECHQGPERIVEALKEGGFEVISLTGRRNTCYIRAVRRAGWGKRTNESIQDSRLEP
ncbi:MAG: hypothetical protein ACP5ID_06300 [Conexivisphaera sp.]